MDGMNLLPWRAARRARRRRAFLLAWGLAGLAALAIAGLVPVLGRPAMAAGQARVEALRARLQALGESSPAAVARERERQAQLASRLEDARRWEWRGQAVAGLLPQVADRLPAGLVLTRFSLAGSRLGLEGLAATPAQVTALPHALQAAGWLAQADLARLEASADGTAYRFQLQARLAGEEAGTAEGRERAPGRLPAREGGNGVR